MIAIGIKITQMSRKINFMENVNLNCFNIMTPLSENYFYYTREKKICKRKSENEWIVKKSTSDFIKRTSISKQIQNFREGDKKTTNKRRTGTMVNSE